MVKFAFNLIDDGLDLANKFFRRSDSASTYMTEEAEEGKNAFLKDRIGKSSNAHLLSQKQSSLVVLPSKHIFHFRRNPFPLRFDWK